MHNDIKDETDTCVVNIATQTMYVQLRTGFKKEYPVSTSRFGIGNISGSLKTPLGTHKICDKVGAFTPLFTIFKATETPENLGIVCTELNVPVESDSVLTRILRLQGLESGLNAGRSESGECVDSFERGIWIHGTNREDLVLQHSTASLGCIRMLNEDIAELFLKIKLDTRVEIVNKPGV